LKIYLITGSAGFIGFHLSKNILSNKNTRVIGLDNINNYYSVNLKKSRLNILKKYKNFHFYKADISNNKKVRQIFANEKPEIVYNLAAQAGVRYSLQNPESYTKSNLLGFFNILDACKENKVKHFLFASTSSAYGNQNKMPIEESFNIDKPIQFYAATKSSNELMAYSYSDLYNMKITALRFFTVYGPWGRPDMALFKFTKNILSNKK
jgi:UDP-glucuronate 4-epimerase